MIRMLSVLSAILLMVGCTSGNDRPQASPGAGSPASTYAAVLAPPVTDPRDARDIAACELLTVEQKQSVGIDPGDDEQIRPGEDRGCIWTTSDGEGVLSAVGVQNPPVGLDGLYRVRDEYPVFEPGQIAGRPIVRADLVDTDDRDCRIFIGVADDQMIQASAKFAFQPGRGCEVAREMAEAMIANLPPAR